MSLLTSTERPYEITLSNTMFASEARDTDGSQATSNEKGTTQLCSIITHKVPPVLGPAVLVALLVSTVVDAVASGTSSFVGEAIGVLFCEDISTIESVINVAGSTNPSSHSCVQEESKFGSGLGLACPPAIT